MIFHENRLLADDSHEISYLFSKIRKMSENLSSAAVVIGALRVKRIFSRRCLIVSLYSCQNYITDRTKVRVFF